MTFRNIICTELKILFYGVIRLKRLRKYTIIGIVFVLAAGSVSHFVYEWTGNNFFAGLIFPMNESVWEHMKLVFFPMLLFSFIMKNHLESEFPCIGFATSGGLLTGTLLVPVLFYTYTGILGYDLPVADIVIFAICVLAAFFATYKLTQSSRLQKFSGYLNSFVCLLCICFFIFSVYPLKIGLFVDPAK